MRVNVIAEAHDWILRRAAQELLPIGATLNRPEGEADVDYYMPYLLAKQKNANIQVGLYTHLETSKDEGSLKKAARFFSSRALFDHHIAISRQTAALVPTENVIHLGSQFSKPIVFGVCGKVHASGRKNEHFVLRLVDAGFRFRAWGHGWPCEIISCEVSQLRAFYESIDYLVVTAGIEGGPVPALEALSLGVPVIAPDVGWCWDYPVIRYERNSYESLLSVIRRLASVPTWETWREKHRKFFEGILHEAR